MDAYNKLFHDWKKDITSTDARVQFIGKQNLVTMEFCFDRLLKNGKTTEQAMDEMMSFVIAVKKSGLAKNLIEMANKKRNST